LILVRQWSYHASGWIWGGFTSGQENAGSGLKEIVIMKKVLLLAFALSLAVGMTTVAHVTMATAKPALAAQPQAAPLKTIQGTVKADGDKLVFVTDEDNKTWQVMNPETLKPHVGHHVELSAHIYADKDSIHVMSVKMLKQGN
jgi:hypothetical protein